MIKYYTRLQQMVARVPRQYLIVVGIIIFGIIYLFILYDHYPSGYEQIKDAVNWWLPS